MFKREPNLVEEIDKERTQQSELLTLVGMGQIAQVKELLQNEKCDIDQQDGSQNTAAIIAARRNDLDMLKVLAYAGADLNCKNFFGQDVYGWAKKHNNKEMLDFLNNHHNPTAGPGM